MIFSRTSVVEVMRDLRFFKMKDYFDAVLLFSFSVLVNVSLSHFFERLVKCRIRVSKNGAFHRS